MASSDLYEMRFEWPHREPNAVIVTGTFDHWSRSIKLKKTESGFVGSVRVPWAEKIKYKFIVDGQWLTQAGQPTEMDPGGFVNNIYLTPPKPERVPAPEPVKLKGDAREFASAPAESVKPTEEAPVPVPQKPVEVVQETPKEEEKAVEAPKPVVAPTPSPPRRLSMPIIPVNAVEHNTIRSSPPPPAVPDYVLPPPPRARSTSPPPVQEIKQAAVLTPEPEPAKLHEVEASPEPVIAIPPEVPIEEQKQEAISHIPVDDLPNVKPEFVEESTKEEEQVAVPAPEPAKEDKPSPALTKEEKPSNLPTPPATPLSKKEFSPSATPTGSPSSSRFGTAASKKKRRSSFFGKIKELFSHEKDKEKEKVKK